MSRRILYSERNIGERFHDGDTAMSGKSDDFNLRQYLFELLLFTYTWLIICL